MRVSLGGNQFFFFFFFYSRIPVCPHYSSHCLEKTPCLFNSDVTGTDLLDEDWEETLLHLCEHVPSPPGGDLSK